MRHKYPFYKPGSVGRFFIGTFFAFCRRYKDREELRRIGVTFAASGRIEVADSRAIQSLLYAATKPAELAGLEDDEEMEPWNNATRTLFFTCYAKAPKFVCSLLTHFQRKANPIRIFMYTTPDTFVVGGRTLTMEIATDGEVAQAIKAKFGVAVSKDAVKRERQFLLKVVKNPGLLQRGLRLEDAVRELRDYLGYAPNPVRLPISDTSDRFCPDGD